MVFSYFWPKQEENQILIDACEFKSVNAFLVKLRAKQKELLAEQIRLSKEKNDLMDEILEIELSDIYLKQIEIAEYKNNTDELKLSKKLRLLKDNLESTNKMLELVVDKLRIMEGILLKVDEPIKEFNKSKMDLSLLASTLQEKLNSITLLEINTLNRPRNNNEMYAYYASRAGATVVGGVAAAALAPSVITAIPAALFGAYAVNKVESEIRDRVEDEGFDAASAQLVHDLIKSVSAVLDKLTSTPTGP